ncbi:DMT family transporter [Brevibacillus sp. B_LB10_24]|uniref:DMT family transporter n=1 Tax=Brevibacillus sp. B_LB10_24 TaxID=3380645 RepID=UPI0038BA97C2
MGWLLVVVGGLIEVVWASALAYADSFLDWAVIAVLVAVSFIMLIRAYKRIPVAPAYSVFVGIGTVGTYVTGVLLGGTYSLKQIVFLLLLLAGVIGLQLTTKEESKEVRN